MADVLTPEDAAGLEAKMGYAPGVGPNTVVPELRFQVLHGRVYVLRVWPDGSTARGEMTVDDLSARFGRDVKREGWYDHDGKYLGDDPGLEAAG